MGDINSRRGRLDGMEAEGGAQVIRARAAIGNVWLCDRPAIKTRAGHNIPCSSITMKQSQNLLPPKY